MYETALTTTIQAIEFVAVVLIAAAVGVAVWRLLRNAARSDRQLSPTDVRLMIGQHLVLALEFLIAADILKTVLAPTLEDLGFLGGIILIRTVLSVSIAYELHRSSTQEAAGESTAANCEVSRGRATR